MDKGRVKCYPDARIGRALFHVWDVGVSGRRKDMAGTSDLSFIEFEGFFPPRTKPAIVIGFGENHGTKQLCIRTIAIVGGNLKDSGGRRYEQPGRKF